MSKLDRLTLSDRISRLRFLRNRISLSWWYGNRQPGVDYRRRVDIIDRHIARLERQFAEAR